MAYMSQQRKKELEPAIQAVCRRYGLKASLAVRHHSTLVLNVRQGAIDFIANYIAADADKLSANKMSSDHIKYLQEKQSIQVNTYWCHEHFTGQAREFLVRVLEVMNLGNHDRSDIQSDYFDVGWYVDINIGQWNKPYALVG